MKNATYKTPDGPLTIEYDENAPCLYCELPVIAASVGGTAVCPWCDCGNNRDGTKWTGEQASVAYRNFRKNYAALEARRKSMELDNEKYHDALRYALRIHAKQKRGNGDPYCLHLMRTSTTVLQLDLPTDMKPLRGQLGIVCLLHDGPEDAKENGFDPATVEADIALNFGQFVLSIVKELTQDPSLPKAERRKKMVEHCGDMSQHAQIIKLADRFDNLSEMATMSAKFIARYCQETPIMLQKMKGACPELEDRIAVIVAGYQRQLDAGTLK